MVYLIIIFAAVSRFVPHIPNFAPITALAIFSAAHLGWKKSVGLTLAVRLVSDLFLGFFSWPLMFAVYVAHLTGVLLGWWVSKARTGKWARVLSSSLAGSLLFFFVTNFAFLYSNYSHDLSGILQAYINGLPFLRGTVLGDLFYSFALFGGYELVIKRYYLMKEANCKTL